MSEPIPEEPSKKMPKSAVWAIAALAVILLFFLQSWAAGRFAEERRRDAIARTVDGFGPLLNQFFLDRKFDRGKRLCGDMAAAGGFRSVTLADASGTILATTDLTKSGKPLDVSNMKAKASVEGTAQGIRLQKLVELAPGNPIGSLEIEIAD